MDRPGNPVHPPRRRWCGARLGEGGAAPSSSGTVLAALGNAGPLRPA